MREVEVVELRQSGLLGSGELFFPFLVANSSLLRSGTAARGNFELNRFTHRERITRCWLELGSFAFGITNVEGARCEKKCRTETAEVRSL